MAFKLLAWRASSDSSRVLPVAVERGIQNRKTFPLPVKVYFEADGTDCSEIDRIKEFLVRFGNREKSKAQLDLIKNFPFVFGFTLSPSNYELVVLEVNKGCSDAAAREVTDPSYGLMFFCKDLNEANFKDILKEIEGLEATYLQTYSVLIVTGSSACNVESPNIAVYGLRNPYEEQDNPFVSFVRSMLASQKRPSGGTMFI